MRLPCEVQAEMACVSHSGSTRPPSPSWGRSLPRWRPNSSADHAGRGAGAPSVPAPGDLVPADARLVLVTRVHGGTVWRPARSLPGGGQNFLKLQRLDRVPGIVRGPRPRARHSQCAGTRGSNRRPRLASTNTRSFQIHKAARSRCQPPRAATAGIGRRSTMFTKARCLLKPAPHPGAAVVDHSCQGRGR